MPAESIRLTRRLGARDRRFLAVFACAAVAAVPATIVLSHGESAVPSGHCVNELRASIMGGATYRYCGAAADRECAHPAGDDDSFPAQCERIGAPTRP